MDWEAYTDALYALLQVDDSSGRAMLNRILPRLIDDAELFLYRHPKLDFLGTRTTDRTQQTAPGSREVTIPAAFIVVEDLALILPSGQEPNTAGARRIPLLRATRQFIDATWPEETLTREPAPFETYWAIYDQQETVGADPPANPAAGIPSVSSPAIIGPTPNGTYVAEFRGTFRPTPFYTVAGFDPDTGDAFNPAATTFLSTWLPDLLISASMSFGTAYQHNWGAQADDPKMGVSWEQHLAKQIEVASSEEFRKKSAGWHWSSYPQPPAAA